MTTPAARRVLTFEQALRVRAGLRAQRQARPPSPYRQDPVGYAREVLRVAWWAKQIEVATALAQHPTVLVRASHSVGKTHLGGGLVNWWFDTRQPSICLTTAPTAAQVRDLLWREVRAQRGGRPGLLPKAPRLEAAPNHYAVGYTANDANAFQGRHEQSLLVIFDEAVGVATEFWHAADGMLSSGPDNRFLAIYNPTDTASEAYQRELLGGAVVIAISALEHPNIAAQLAGQPKPYPQAIDLAWVDERVRGERPWCEPIAAADATTDDLEWPPGSGDWYRPGPLFESRVLGRWPSTAVGSVWSEAAFEAACRAQLPEPLELPIEIGCDVARHGDDATAIHVRRGPVSLAHETHHGWDTVRTAARLMELARDAGRRCGLDGRRVPLKVDDDGVGGGVTDVLRAGDWHALPIGAGARAIDAEGYPNRRSELWFVVAERARHGQLDLSRLPRPVQLDLRRQLLAPTWRVDAQGRRVVEPKEQTKRRLGRSPDDADALNLAYAVVPPPAASAVAPRAIVETYGADRRRLSRLGLR